MTDGTGRPPAPGRGWNQHEPRRFSKGSHPFTDSARGPRLHKVMADAGVGSRRACEGLIADGSVTVNGHRVADPPAWVDPARDRIEVDGHRIKPPAPPLYIMLFKPRGIVCSNRAQGDRRRAIDLVDHPGRARLFPVGRLDVESSGLLLLTNDGTLANLLTHPRYGIHKTYEVTVEGTLDEAGVRKLERGVFLADRDPAPGRSAGRRTSPSRLRLMRASRDRTRLLMELREGRNRQIRRMMLRVGHKVRKLRRIKLGPLTLRGLRPGQWRELTPQEVASLRRAATRAESKNARRTSRKAASTAPRARPAKNQGPRA